MQTRNSEAHSVPSITSVLHFLWVYTTNCKAFLLLSAGLLAAKRSLMSRDPATTELTQLSQIQFYRAS
jgi:hypothetical protein